MTIRIDASTHRHAYIPAEIKRPAAHESVAKLDETDAQRMVRLENQRVAQNRPVDAQAAAKLATLVRNQLTAQAATAIRTQAHLDVQKVAALLD